MTTEEITTDHISDERKFLHALSSPMIVIRAMTNKVMSELKAEIPNLSKAGLIARLDKVMDAVKSMEDMHAEHKALIHDRESRN